jgi:hypothetical protein
MSFQHNTQFTIFPNQSSTAYDKFTTPKKDFVQAMTNSKTMSSGNSHKFCRLFSNDKPQGFLFRNYSSSNLNNLLGSDFKFKSPSKLIEARIDMSPWKSDDNYRISFSKIFESSPMRASNYKNYIGEMESQTHQEITPVEIPVLRSEPREFQNFPQKFSSGYALSKNDVGDHGLVNSAESQNFDSLSHEDLNGTNRKRKRKNINQLKVLKSEYLKNKDWSKELITKISEITGLTESQIYKWNWDQKKKEEDELQADAIIAKPNFNDSGISNLFPPAQCPVQDKENIDISFSNFKLVSVQSPTKSKYLGSKNFKPAGLQNKTTEVNGGFQGSLSREEFESIGKRRPFGQVNDSRVDSAKRYKSLKI